MSQSIPTLDQDMESRGYHLLSDEEKAARVRAADNPCAVSTADFQPDDLLDLAENHGTVVATEPSEGIMGFVTFGEGEFIDFCRDLITQVRRADDAGPPVMIQTHMDYVMAVGAFNPLARMLRQTYSGQEWPKEDRYVQAFDQLFQAIIDYERRHPHFTGPAAQMAGLIRLSDKNYRDNN